MCAWDYIYIYIYVYVCVRLEDKQWICTHVTWLCPVFEGPWRQTPNKFHTSVYKYDSACPESLVCRSRGIHAPSNLQWVNSPDHFSSWQACHSGAHIPMESDSSLLRLSVARGGHVREKSCCCLLINYSEVKRMCYLDIMYTDRQRHKNMNAHAHIVISQNHLV